MSGQHLLDNIQPISQSRITYVSIEIDFSIVQKRFRNCPKSELRIFMAERINLNGSVLKCSEEVYMYAMFELHRIRLNTFFYE